MKLKILIMPLTVIVMIVLAIWYVYPAYSNGEDGVKEKKEELEKEQTKLTSIKDKNGSINKFSSQIASLATSKDVLYKFIPEERKEEEIVNSLNSIAQSSSLAVSMINVSKNSNTEKNVLPESNATEDKTRKMVTDEKIDVQIQFQGSYEKIKEFFTSLYNIDRYNGIKSLEIEKVVDPKNNNNVLSGDMIINFNLLKKVKIADEDINDELFTGAGLDLSSINTINEQKNIKNRAIIIDKQGKTNLFIP